MKIIKLTFAAFASIAVVTPVQAQDSDPIEVDRIRDRDDIQIDPTKAYLLMESPTVAVLNFILVPTEGERANWAAQRAEALAEAIDDYPGQLSRFERSYRTWSNGSRRGREPVRPVEPTEASFPWPDLESRRVVTIGPLNRFAKSDDVSLWLYAVPPGDYLFYGFGAPGFNFCSCMGSVGFPVETGKVTAVRVEGLVLDGQGNEITEPPEGSNSTDIITRLGMRITQHTNASYDPRIPRDMIVAAAFEPYPNLPNWFGGMVSRVAPIDGLFRYERDRMIDLRQEAAPQPIEQPIEIAEEAVEEGEPIVEAFTPSD